MRALLAINQHLNIQCHYGGCGHTARWTAVEALERLGPDATMADAKRRLSCAVCGAKGAWGHLWVYPCTLDAAAWSAREKAARGVVRGLGTPAEELEATLASLRQSLGDQELGGDGPVQWPVERPTKGL